MTTLSRDQVEQFLRLATLDRANVNVDGWIGVYSALRMMIDHDAALQARMTPIIEALESLCHAVERGETDDDYLRQLAQDGRWAITPPKAVKP